MIQTLSTVMQLLMGPYFSDIGPNSRTVQCAYFIIYEFCFTCFKVEYKKSYIFQSSSSEIIIEI